MAFEEDETAVAKQNKQLEKEKKAAKRNEIVQMLKERASEAPEEMHYGTGQGSDAMQRMREKEDERTRYEEENFLRLSVTKKDRQNKKKLQRLVNPDLQMLDNFGEFTALLEKDATERGEEAVRSQAYSVAMDDLRQSNTAAHKKAASGEQDVPLRAMQKLKEKALLKQKKHEAKMNKKPAKEKEPVEQLEPVDNEFYDAIAEQARTKKVDKEEKKRKREIVEEEEIEGKREISEQILKNQGLRKYRKKEERNVRVKNRNKYEAALQKRRKQVQEVKEKETGYGGEATGIKSKTVKSVKLK